MCALRKYSQLVNHDQEDERRDRHRQRHAHAQHDDGRVGDGVADDRQEPGDERHAIIVFASGSWTPAMGSATTRNSPVSSVLIAEIESGRRRHGGRRRRAASPAPSARPGRSSGRVMSRRSATRARSDAHQHVRRHGRPPRAEVLDVPACSRAVTAMSRKPSASGGSRHDQPGSVVPSFRGRPPSCRQRQRAARLAVHELDDADDEGVSNRTTASASTATAASFARLSRMRTMQPRRQLCARARRRGGRRAATAADGAGARRRDRSP